MLQTLCVLTVVVVAQASYYGGYAPSAWAAPVAYAAPAPLPYIKHAPAVDYYVSVTPTPRNHTHTLTMSLRPVR